MISGRILPDREGRQTVWTAILLLSAVNKEHDWRNPRQGLVSPCFPHAGTLNLLLAAAGFYLASPLSVLCVDLPI